MRNDDNHHDPIGVQRNVIKTTPNRITALWLFGIFILASATYVGVQIGNYLSGIAVTDPYWFGFFVALGVSSVVGWFTITLQENAQDFKIKIVREQ